MIKVYKIVNNINDDIYIGSTKSPLYKRLHQHKQQSIKHPDRNNLYRFVSENGWDSCRIIIIEEIECKNKEEQLKKEQYYIDLFKPKLNKNNASGKICEHNRIRSKCKTCGGGSFCTHNRIRSRCKTCGGSEICIHNRERSKCKTCEGGSICIHNRITSQCKDCNNFHCEYCENKYCSKSYLYRHLLIHF